MQNNPYIKTNWRDHIVDIESNQVIQEGTRFTASRANNIEEGIFGAYEWLKDYHDEITKLRIQLEMLGRAPTNNGTFFDPMDAGGNSKALTLLKERAIVQNAVNVGAKEITVDDSSVFIPGRYITIYDDEQNETVKINTIVGNTITMSALVNQYKKGARVARSNVEIEDDKLAYKEWGNYSIEITEVI